MRFLKKIIDKRVAPIEQQISLLRNDLSALKEKMSFLEDRLTSYYSNRWDAIDCVADYLVNAEIGGDYAEFGVFQGTTFAYACKIFGPIFPKMRFWAFDSFEGLPAPSGIDRDAMGFSSGFFEGQFACTEKKFMDHVIKTSLMERKRLNSVKGWFKETLLPDTAARLSLNSLAAIWIDCDLYESTMPILRFITPLLKIGTVILFDDWRCFRNLPEFGQQRACFEWLEANPQIMLHDFISFGFHGRSFTVGKC